MALSLNITTCRNDSLASMRFGLGAVDNAIRSDHVSEAARLLDERPQLSDLVVPPLITDRNLSSHLGVLGLIERHPVLDPKGVTIARFLGSEDRDEAGRALAIAECLQRSSLWTQRAGEVYRVIPALAGSKFAAGVLRIRARDGDRQALGEVWQQSLDVLRNPRKSLHEKKEAAATLIEFSVYAPLPHYEILEECERVFNLMGNQSAEGSPVSEMMVSYYEQLQNLVQIANSPVLHPITVATAADSEGNRDLNAVKANLGSFWAHTRVLQLEKLIVGKDLVTEGLPPELFDDITRLSCVSGAWTSGADLRIRQLSTQLMGFAINNRMEAIDHLIKMVAVLDADKNIAAPVVKKSATIFHFNRSAPVGYRLALVAIASLQRLCFGAGEDVASKLAGYVFDDNYGPIVKGAALQVLRVNRLATADQFSTWNDIAVRSGGSADSRPRTAAINLLRAADFHVLAGNTGQLQSLLKSGNDLLSFISFDILTKDLYSMPPQQKYLPKELVLFAADIFIKNIPLTTEVAGKNGAYWAAAAGYVLGLVETEVLAHILGAQKFAELKKCVIERRNTDLQNVRDGKSSLSLTWINMTDASIQERELVFSPNAAEPYLTPLMVNMGEANELVYGALAMVSSGAPIKVMDPELLMYASALGTQAAPIFLPLLEQQRERYKTAQYYGPERARVLRLILLLTTPRSYITPS